MFYWLYSLLKKQKPIVKGFLFRLLFSGKKLKISKGFKCDSWPDITVTHNAKVIIGENVYCRRNVEIRSHNDSIVELKGNNRIDRGVRLLGANKAKIVLEQGVRIGLYSVFNGGDSIFVGQNSLISGFVYLQTSMHNYKLDNASIKDQGYSHGAIVLEEDTWLGTHVVILPNVVIKKGCIVGSNAVVNKTFEENSILAGIPAKFIKTR